MGGSYFRHQRCGEGLPRAPTAGGVGWAGEETPAFPSLPQSPFIIQQVVYYTEMHKIFGDLTAQIDRPGLSDEQRERENDAKLSELRALSIVADD